MLPERGLPLLLHTESCRLLPPACTQLCSEPERWGCWAQYLLPFPGLLPWHWVETMSQRLCPCLSSLLGAGATGTFFVHQCQGRKGGRRHGGLPDGCCPLLAAQVVLVQANSFTESQNGRAWKGTLWVI